MADAKKIKVRVTKERSIYGPGGKPYPVGHELMVAKVPYGWRSCVEVIEEAEVKDGEALTGDKKPEAKAAEPDKKPEAKAAEPDKK